MLISLIIKLIADELISLTINWLAAETKGTTTTLKYPSDFVFFLECVSILNNLLKISHIMLTRKLKKK